MRATDARNRETLRATETRSSAAEMRSSAAEMRYSAAAMAAATTTAMAATTSRAMASSVPMNIYRAKRDACRENFENLGRHSTLLLFCFLETVRRVVLST